MVCCRMGWCVAWWDGVLCGRMVCYGMGWDGVLCGGMLLVISAQLNRRNLTINSH